MKLVDTVDMDWSSDGVSLVTCVRDALGEYQERTSFQDFETSYTVIIYFEQYSKRDPVAYSVVKVEDDMFCLTYKYL